MRDNAGVGGFFEDLPVLVFVLLGVFVLVATGVFASREISEHREAERLEFVAQNLLDAVISGVTAGDSEFYMLTVGALKGLNLTGIVRSVTEGVSYCISIVLLYPRAEWLCSASSGAPMDAVSTGFARQLLNATDHDGTTAVLEVKALVW